MDTSNALQYPSKIVWILKEAKGIGPRFDFGQQPNIY